MKALGLQNDLASCCITRASGPPKAALAIAQHSDSVSRKLIQYWMVSTMSGPHPTSWSLPHLENTKPMATPERHIYSNMPPNPQPSSTSGPQHPTSTSGPQHPHHIFLVPSPDPCRSRTIKNIFSQTPEWFDFQRVPIYGTAYRT